MARSRGLGMGKPQVPPLRCAPVGMTRGAVLPKRVVAEQELFIRARLYFSRAVNVEKMPGFRGCVSTARKNRRSLHYAPSELRWG